eukprot:g13082.t1 g13082   contig7:836408-836965(+)
MAPQPPKQSSNKTTTWADQAQGFESPSKQHTAWGRIDGDETAEASHPQGNTGRNGNRYASLDETQTDGDETATTNFIRVLVRASLDETQTDGDETAEASHPQGNTGRNGNRYASLDETQTDGDETATTNFIRVLVRASLDETQTDGDETAETSARKYRKERKSLCLSMKHRQMGMRLLLRTLFEF